jgi:hypothetical protein
MSTVTHENRGRIFQLSIIQRNEKALEKLISAIKKVNDKVIFIFQLTHSGALSHSVTTFINWPHGMLMAAALYQS